MLISLTNLLAMAAWPTPRSAQYPTSWRTQTPCSSSPACQNHQPKHRELRSTQTPARTASRTLLTSCLEQYQEMPPRRCRQGDAAKEMPLRDATPPRRREAAKETRGRRGEAAEETPLEDTEHKISQGISAANEVTRFRDEIYAEGILL